MKFTKKTVKKETPAPVVSTLKEQIAKAEYELGRFVKLRKQDPQPIPAKAIEYNFWIKHFTAVLENLKK